MSDRLEVLTTFPKPILARIEQTLPFVRITTIPSEEAPPPHLHADVLLIPPWDTGNLEAVLALGIQWVHTIGTFEID